MKTIITLTAKSKVNYALIILLLTTLLISVSLQSNAQQDLNYSKYMSNQVPLNTAVSLLEQGGAVNALVRKQYVGIEGSPSTFIFDASLPVQSVNGAAGVVVISDQFAVEHLTEVNAFFAKGIQLAANHFLGVSLSAGYKLYTANYSKLDGNDQTFNSDIRDSQPNVGFGLMFYTDHYFLGASVPELYITSLGNASQKNVYNFKNHYNFSGAYLFGEQDDDFRVKPAVMIAYANGIPLVANLSTTFFIKSVFGVGANLRTNNEATGLISFMTSNFRVGYAYQFSTSSNTVSVRNATHEVSLSYRFGKNLSAKLL